jgi:iron complex outermembrane recepter protein
MTSSKKITHAVRQVLLASAFAASAGPVFAQQQAPASPQGAVLEEVVVTGTRITIPGVQSSSPITTIGIDEISREQAFDIEKVLRLTPAAVPGDNPGANNGSAGVTTVNLRGLGPNRNLVLMDGKRMVPYNVNGYVDISAVPVALLERVDVVTGGASAVYGSDAMSGVVNFIMKKNFEGIAFEGEASETGHSDGKTYSGSITMGASLDAGRGNAVLSLNVTKRDPVTFGQRSYGVDNIDSQSGASSAAEGGSFTTVPALLFGNVSGYQFDANGNLNNVFDAAGNPLPTFKSFNFNPYNLYQTPQDKWSALALANYEINSHAEAYARFAYASIDVKTQLAPSGTFGFGWNLPIANPYLNNQARNVLCQDASLPFDPTFATVPADCLSAIVPLSFYRRMVEVGPRITDYRNNTFQVVAGVRGSIAEGWGYDVSYQRGRSTRSLAELNDINGVSMQQALLSTSTTACNDPSNGCVPINLFGPVGSIKDNQAAFVRLDLLINEIYTQDVTTGSIHGDLGAFRSPWADRPVGFAVGAEYRRESGVIQPDANAANANIPVGYGQTVPTSGSYTVKEGFTELLVPVVSDKPFAKAVDLQLGYRYSEYDLAGNTNTYRIGADWAPLQSVRFRAEYQRAVRAPNIAELFSPVAFGTGNLATDPCAGAAPTTSAALAALCVATGAPAARVAAGSIAGPIAGQVNNFTGGNLKLKPEKGDTYTYGVVLDGGAGWGVIRHPTLTLDYYTIKIDGAINAPALTDVVNGCYSTDLNPAQTFNALCALISRNAQTGALNGGPTVGVYTVQANLAFLKAEGIELGARFDVDLAGSGKLAVALDANYYLKNDFQNSSTAPLNQCAGYYGQNCGTQTGGPVSKTRFVQRTTWIDGPWEVGYLWRYLSGVREEAATAVLPQFASIGAYNYLDVTAAYSFNDKTTIRLTINNVLDKNPPFVGGSAGDTVSNGGNTFPGVYDALGRVFAVGVKVGF